MGGFLGKLLSPTMFQNGAVILNSIAQMMASLQGGGGQEAA